MGSYDPPGLPVRVTEVFFVMFPSLVEVECSISDVDLCPSSFVYLHVTSYPFLRAGYIINLSNIHVKFLLVPINYWHYMKVYWWSLAVFGIQLACMTRML